MEMYNIPTAGHNLEIEGQPFFIESISPTEAIRRREYNFNNLVGGTQNVTKGAYVGLEFSITTHVKVNPDRPDIHNTIFKKLMSKPVKVISPEMGGEFTAIVKIKPEHETPQYLKLTIDIKEVPERDSKIPGEKFVVPAPHKIKVQNTSQDSDDWFSTQNMKKYTNLSRTKKKVVIKSSKSKKSRK